MDRSEIDGIVRKLIAGGRTIATMESCTSGLIASLITDTEGASAIFPGGYVTYANETKLLTGVDRAVIETYGVYSPECAEAMAAAVQRNLGTEFAVGVTGTTGNTDPNNADSVCGTMYFCIRQGTESVVCEFHADVSGMERKEIKRLYAGQVFRKLGEILRGEARGIRNDEENKT